MERATAWRRIDQVCPKCGEPLLGRTVTTEGSKPQAPMNVHTEKRCRDDDCPSNG